ncbi:hypothetical protein [Streptomyces sp. CB02923]|uniref:hypothetical protein n=1 Tax=Streptomyces sp. CB02923 TaxID=1718985 RepID=UPI0019007BFD|nr:hypothetical protein [Streptomyces sp. CB02923]
MADLERLPSLYRACGQALDGSGTAGGLRERTSGGALPGIPLNTAASDIRSDILAVLASWAGTVVQARRVTPPRRTVGALSGFLVRHADWLGAHGAAGDAATEIRKLARRASRVADPAVHRLITVGPCPESGCTGSLQALIRPGVATAAVEIRCRVDPAHRWSGEHLMELKRRIRAAASGTAPGAAAGPDSAPAPASAPAAWLSAADISRLWGTPVGSVYRLASQRGWRRRSQGGRTRYHEADVTEALCGRAS